MIRSIFALALCLCTVFLSAQENPTVYVIKNGLVHFKSEAPLELIHAESTEIRGLIDFTNQTFAFSIPVNTFSGFNSALQREHFNENYMETTRFPRAIFSGRMIEKLDPNQNGQYIIRTKGKLNIHGIEQERIIRSTIHVNDGILTISSQFSVLLQDHNIAIPKVVQHKIAEEITVAINANGEKR
jgi:hypothetical protein